VTFYSNEFDYIRSWYHVPAKRRMRISVNGKMGTITCGRGQYLRVRFDGDKTSYVCHPTWETIYYDKDGKVLMNNCDPTNNVVKKYENLINQPNKESEEYDYELLF